MNPERHTAALKLPHTSLMRAIPPPKPEPMTESTFAVASLLSSSTSANVRSTD